MAAERTIGPWTILRKIDEGGNAIVYEAQRDGETVALKGLKTAKAGREPYKRFVREVEFLGRIGDVPGVLPVVDSFLPETPASGDRPWLAMPIAVPARDALDGASLRTVVEAVSSFAKALAWLAAEHNVAHRDIKPGNLYERDGAWLVGDFGLIALPDVDELTRTGRPLGPAHFMAYEMLNDPRHADPFPADVYSLAKTLWVLACVQNYPPQGHQAVPTRGFGIADLRPERGADLLDQLVERMTRLQPTERPTMAEVADELRRWLELRDEPAPIDLSGTRAEVLAKLEAELAAEDLLQQYRDAGAAAARRLQELVRPLDQELGSLLPRAEVAATPDKLTRNLVFGHRHSGSPEIIFSWARRSEVGSGEDFRRYALRMGRGLEVTADGVLFVRAFIEVGIKSLGGSDFSWQSQARSAAVGSVAADDMLREAVAELGEKLTEAAGVFAEKVPARG